MWRSGSLQPQRESALLSAQEPRPRIIDCIAHRYASSRVHCDVARGTFGRVDGRRRERTKGVAKRVVALVPGQIQSYLERKLCSQLSTAGELQGVASTKPLTPPLAASAPLPLYIMVQDEARRRVTGESNHVCSALERLDRFMLCSGGADVDESFEMFQEGCL